ncbi:FtsX-like permease family protein [Streptosporangium sp. NPDC051023]|uniref:ABC transporter permease n=1 Tax=Streptosporangium sp. NPDC051023 TaxID=3155410 RepID=UPI00344E455C
MSAFLAALRISRRDITRARARSALIVVMIGLPVLAVTVALTLVTTREMTPLERLPVDLGTADARLAETGAATPIRQELDGRSWEPSRTGKPRSQAEVQALAGPGWRLVPMSEDYAVYRTDDAYDQAAIRELDLRDPLTNGMHPLVAGRYPRTPDEVAVTVSLKTAIGTTLGYTVDDVPKRVVGTVRDRPYGPGRTIIGLPGSLIPASETSGVRRFWLTDAPAPVTWKETLRLNRAGMAVISRAVLEGPPPGAEARLVINMPRSPVISVNDVATLLLGITLAVIEVVLMTGPAFAVGIRRRRRELALISAQGGSARHLKMVVLADGLTLGLVAAVLGAALGIGAARGIVSYLGVWPAGELGPFEVPAGQIALVAALGVLSGVVAAVVPAVQAARVNVVAALAGRRAEARARAGWPLPGLLLLVLGSAAMLYGSRGDTEAVMFLGGVLGLLGLVMVMPWLVRLAGRRAGGLPLPLRLAVRDASRNRSRTAPAIVAVLAAAAAFSTVAVSVASNQTAYEKHYMPRYPRGTLAVYGDDVTEEAWKRIRPIVEAKLPGVPLVESYHAVDSGGRAVYFSQLDGTCENCDVSMGPLELLPVGGPDLLRLLLGRTDAAAEAALAGGRAVIFNPKAVRDGKVHLSVWNVELAEEKAPVAFPATVATLREPSVVLGVMPAAALTGSGFVPKLTQLIVDPKVASVTPRQEQLVSGPVRAVTSKVAVWLELGVPRDRRNESMTIWVMALLAGLVVFGCTFAVAGLAAADARPDLETLSAVGAPPGIRRLVVAGQALFIAGVGVPLGLLIGLFPGLATVSRDFANTYSRREIGVNGIPFERAGIAFSVPWPTLLAVGIGLPLVAGLIVTAFARTKVTPVRRAG